MTRRWLACTLLVVAGGCGLVNSNLFRYDYSFAVQPFTASLSPAAGGGVANGGGGGSAGGGGSGGGQAASTVPDVTCDPSAASDSCRSLPTPNDASPVQLTCDAATSKCVARAEITLPYPVDLSSQALPNDVVQFSVDSVSIKKVAYWVDNLLNVAVPSIDLYVAPSAVTSADDSAATLLGSMAMLPANDSVCGDSVDSSGDAAANGATVCDLKLTENGKTALAGFVKSYKTPFQFIAHTVITAHANDPWPTGSINYWVRPTVSFSILK